MSVSERHVAVADHKAERKFKERGNLCEIASGEIDKACDFINIDQDVREILA